MILIYILSLLFWPVVIIGIVVFFIRRRRKGIHIENDKKWYLQLALSKEDAVSQFFIILSILFFGVTALAFNRDLGEPFSWINILFIIFALSFASAYYLKTFYTLVLGLLSINFWWALQGAKWAENGGTSLSVVFAGAGFLALIFYVLGHLHEEEIRWKRFSIAYLIIGILSITGIFFQLSSKSGLLALEEMTRGNSFFNSLQLTLTFSIILIALIGISFYTLNKKLISYYEFFVVLFLALVFGIIALLPQQDLFLQVGRSRFSNQELSGTGFLWALIFNLVIFLQLLGLIFSGYLRKETWLINLGAFFMFILIIQKYFDWFFTFIDKSVFFIGAGILLFGVGWSMEKGRRYMISNMKN